MTNQTPDIPSPEAEEQLNPSVGDVVVVRKQINDMEVRPDFDAVVTWRQDDGLSVTSFGIADDGSEWISGFPGSCTLGEIIAVKDHWDEDRIVAAYANFLDKNGLFDNRAEIIDKFRNRMQGKS